MSKIQISQESRIDYDPQSHVIRSFFDAGQPVTTKGPFNPYDVAKEALSDSANLFGWQTDLADLHPHTTLNGPGAHSVRFTQEYKKTPVYASEVVVNIQTDGRLNSIYNNYHYEIPADIEPQKLQIGSGQAKEIIANLLPHYESHRSTEPELIVYQYQKAHNHPPKTSEQPTPGIAASAPSIPTIRATFLERAAAGFPASAERPKEGHYFLAWMVTATTKTPTHSWRIFIDAMTGNLVNVIDLLEYATGAGRVFDPNPIVSSGNTGLSTTTPLVTLNGQASAVVMARLNPPDGNGNLHLDGTFVNMAEIESPAFAEPVSALGNFLFNANDRNFLAAMVYYHIDRFQQYIQADLGLNNVANFSIPVDPQGFSGADNSRTIR